MFFPSFFIALPCLPPLVVESKSRGAFDLCGAGAFARETLPRSVQLSKPTLASLAGRMRPSLHNLSDYFNAHRARGAADAFDCRLDGGGVQVGHLLLGDVFDLLGGDFAD